MQVQIECRHIHLACTYRQALTAVRLMCLSLTTLPLRDLDGALRWSLIQGCSRAWLAVKRDTGSRTSSPCTYTTPHCQPKIIKHVANLRPQHRHSSTTEPRSITVLNSAETACLTSAISFSPLKLLLLLFLCLFCLPPCVLLMLQNRVGDCLIDPVLAGC